MPLAEDMRVTTDVDFGDRAIAPSLGGRATLLYGPPEGATLVWTSPYPGDSFRPTSRQADGHEDL
jgi:hypothetical protein